jgi:hypothetical protein
MAHNKAKTELIRTLAKYMYAIAALLFAVFLQDPGSAFWREHQIQGFAFGSVMVVGVACTVIAESFEDVGFPILLGFFCSLVAGFLCFVYYLGSHQKSVGLGASIGFFVFLGLYGLFNLQRRKKA